MAPVRCRVLETSGRPDIHILVSGTHRLQHISGGHGPHLRRLRPRIFKNL
jgi:hypothetical protein